MILQIPTYSVTALVIGITVIIASCVVAANDGSDETVSATMDNGLGTNIQWHALDDGLALAKQENKPLMLIIHKSWCGACKALKPKFRNSEIIAKYSKNFIMVNTMDEDEPSGDKYRPDGGYVPRLLFFDPDGELFSDITNENGNPQYKYYYYDEHSIVSSMERVAALFASSSTLETFINDNQKATTEQSPVKSEL